MSGRLAREGTVEAHLEADVDVADAELEAPQQQAPQVRQERPARPAGGAIAAASPAIAAVTVVTAVMTPVTVAAAIPASSGATLPCIDMSAVCSMPGVGTSLASVGSEAVCRGVDVSGCTA